MTARDQGAPPERPTVEVGGVTFTILSRYERATAVNGRYFFAAGSNGRGYTLFEHDADLRHAGTCRCIGRRLTRLSSTANLAAEILRLTATGEALPPDPYVHSTAVAQEQNLALQVTELSAAAGGDQNMLEQETEGNYYDANGVVAWWYQPEYGAGWFGVSDAEFNHYRITFSASEADTVSVGVNATSRNRPGELANYTYDLPTDCARDDVLEISDTGLLSVFKRARSGDTDGSLWSVDFRAGFMMQLPPEYVEPIRLTIEKARGRAAKMNAAYMAKGHADVLVDPHEAQIQALESRMAGRGSCT